MVRRSWTGMGPSPAADQHLAGITLLLACTLSAILITGSRKRRQDHRMPDRINRQATAQNKQQQRNDSDPKPHHS